MQQRHCCGGVLGPAARVANVPDSARCTCCNLLAHATAFRVPIQLIPHLTAYPVLSLSGLLTALMLGRNALTSARHSRQRQVVAIIKKVSWWPVPAPACTAPVMQIEISVKGALVLLLLGLLKGVISVRSFLPQRLELQH